MHTLSQQIFATHLTSPNWQMQQEERHQTGDFPSADLCRSCARICTCGGLSESPLTWWGHPCITRNRFSNTCKMSTPSYHSHALFGMSSRSHIDRCWHCRLLVVRMFWWHSVLAANLQRDFFTLLQWLHCSRAEINAFSTTLPRAMQDRVMLHYPATATMDSPDHHSRPPTFRGHALLTTRAASPTAALSPSFLRDCPIPPRITVTVTMDPPPGPESTWFADQWEDADWIGKLKRADEHLLVIEGFTHSAKASQSSVSLVQEF